jgi:hypothetical protein
MFTDINLEQDLSQMLLEKKAITPDQLKDCIKRQKLKGGSLTQCFIDGEYLKDTDVATYLTCQYGYSYIPLKAYNVTDEALGIIPAQVVCDYSIFPIEKNDRLLTVAMADPLNKGVIEMLRQLTHCEIIVFVSTRSEINEAILRHYSPSLKRFELDRHQKTSDLRDDVINPFITNGFYAGPNRRRYRRLNRTLNIEYFLYPHAVTAKIDSISMAGVLFESHMVLPKGLQLAATLFLDNGKKFSSVIELVRCDPKKLLDTLSDENAAASGYFHVGAFFNFLSDVDQDALAEYLQGFLKR